MDDPKDKPEPDPSAAGFPGSPNEPVPQEPQPQAAAQAAAKPAPADEEEDELPSNAELEKMTRAELDELADAREVDISSAGNKGDVIDLLRKDARKRRR